MDIDLATLSVQHLLTLDRQILNGLRQRQIVRTGNSPVGDWAEPAHKIVQVLSDFGRY